MKRILLAATICLFMFGLANADDPGNQDSLIVRNTVLDTSATQAIVWMWAVTDDSVFYYNCPLRFTYSGEGITYDSTSYLSLLLQWDDCYDSLLVAEDFLRMFGWADISGGDNPPLLTNGLRYHLFNLWFTIDPAALDQMVWIDTTNDFINGSLLFGLIHGVISFVPAFQNGYIQFGNPILGTEDEIADLPSEFVLAQNYPNPFNPQTSVMFDLPKAQNISLEIYNILGQHVKTLANGMYEAGRYNLSWNGTNDYGQDVPSGIYFYSLRTDEFAKTNKMTLIR